MNFKAAIYICIQFAILNVTYSQSLNRIISNCGLNTLPIAETLLPNQLNYLPYDLPYEVLPNVFPGAIQPTLLPNALQRQPNVLPSVAAPTIIQDNTVSSNLANALQLLVVSNLLRNTLPQARDVPAYPPVEYLSSAPYGGYNYLY